jgi:hypothetical protein
VLRVKETVKTAVSPAFRGVVGPVTERSIELESVKREVRASAFGADANRVKAKTVRAKTAKSRFFMLIVFMFNSVPTLFHMGFNGYGPKINPCASQKAQIFCVPQKEKRRG